MIFGKEKPCVLFAGSGILQAYGGMSWNAYLDSIAEDKSLLDNPLFKQCPSPLQAILLTNDQVNVALRDKKKVLLDPQASPECYDFCRDVLRMGFDHILTTNYTYEFEAASLNTVPITEYRLKKMVTRTQKNAERQYLLHTYNKVNFEGRENRVWHIHGEHRKPSSIVLGHYYYGNLLFHIKDELKKIDKNRWSKDGEKTERGASWLDAFLFGDIYCVGFGFGVFEFDLWWLLNRKAREKENRGKLYFYEPKSKEYNPKLELLNTLKDASEEKLVEIIDFDFEAETNMEYASFYQRALEDIRSKMK